MPRPPGSMGVFALDNPWHYIAPPFFRLLLTGTISFVNAVQASMFCFLFKKGYYYCCLLLKGGGVAFLTD